MRANDENEIPCGAAGNHVARGAFVRAEEGRQFLLVIKAIVVVVEQAIDIHAETIDARAISHQQVVVVKACGHPIDIYRWQVTIWNDYDLAVGLHAIEGNDSRQSNEAGDARV